MCIEPNATALLLTARPTDPKRTALISVFRTHFPSLTSYEPAGDLGVQAETERLLCTILSLGLSPGRIRSGRTFSAGKTPLLTVEIAAAASFGDERVFTETACESSQGVIRLCTSRSKADLAAGQEIELVIDSLTVKDGKAPTPISAAARAAELVRDYREALVLVEGEKGVGSGFLCDLGGTLCAITNAHVLSGNSGIRLTNLDGVLLSVTTSAVAVGHDVIRMEAPGARKAFSILEAIDRNVKIGDPVVVLGNPEGARVVKPIEGTVVGVGPNLVEVDAPFVRGNSGSPIIHVPTGKVLGIATYLVEKKIPDTTGFFKSGRSFHIETRRFGYRIDSIKEWEPLVWSRFHAQSLQVGKIEALSEDFIRLVNQTSTGGRINPADFGGSPLLRPLESFSQSYSERGHISRTDHQALSVRLVSDLRNITRADIAAFDSRGVYDYFRRRVAEQSRLREELYTGFNQALDGLKASHPNQ